MSSPYDVNGKTPVAAWIPSRDSAGNGTTTLNDLVGSNNGTLTNMDAATDWVADTGAGGIRALDFDGNDDEVICGPSGLSGQSFSISGWVHQRSLTANPAIVRLVPTSGNEFIFQPTNRVFSDNANAANLLFRTNPVLNRWNHFVMTFSANSYQFFQNGMLELSGTFAVPITVGTNSVRIGRRTSTVDGLIDDVRIFNQALSADDVYYLWKGGLGRGRQWNSNDLTNNLVWYWDLSSADATIIDQHSGLVLPRVGTVTTDPTGGPDGGPCVDVGSAAGKYTRASVAKTPSYDDGYTVNIWAYSTGNSTNFNTIINHRNVGVGAAFYFQMGVRSVFASLLNQDFAITYDSGAVASRAASSAQWPINIWQMLTLVDNGTTTSLYRNASLLATASTTLGVRSTPAANFAIGGSSWQGVNTQNDHRGKLAKAGVWNVPLTQAEITRLYNSGRGLNYSGLGRIGSPAAAIRFFHGF